MQYTVWSRGELIGTTELEFRGVGFDRARSGNFHPNVRGQELMWDLATDYTCMRAYMHRNYRDENGASLVDPEYLNSDWFGDVAEHLHLTAHFELELKDELGHVIPVLEIGIQDKLEGALPPSEEALARLRNDEATILADEAKRAEGAKKIDPTLLAIMEEDQKFMDSMIDRTESHALDLTVPVGWDYEENRGDNELGSGWAPPIREFPDYPRYQVHLVLA